jgi:hypothetical protein
MADYAKVVKLRDTETDAAYIFSATSDGSGETAVQKIDISAIKMAATKVRIKKLKWSCSGMTAELLFDHSTDDSAIVCANNGELDESKDAPIIDPGSSGGTGYFLLTSKVTASTVGSGYTIYIEIAKVG